MTDALTDERIRELRQIAWDSDDATLRILCEAALLRNDTARVNGINRTEARQLLAERLGVEEAS